MLIFAKIWIVNALYEYNKAEVKYQQGNMLMKESFAYSHKH